MQFFCVAAAQYENDSFNVHIILRLKQGQIPQIVSLSPAMVQFGYRTPNDLAQDQKLYTQKLQT